MRHLRLRLRRRTQTLEVCLTKRFNSQFLGVFLLSARIEKARELIFKRSLHIKSKHFGIPHTSKGMKIESN